MSDELEPKDAAEAEPVIEAPKEEPDKPEGEDPPVGKQFIDFKDLPPQVEARFKRIYGNMKEYERVAQETARVNRALVDRLEKLENSDFQKQVDGLHARRQEAWENGDFKKAASLDDELLDYKLAAKERAKSGKPSVEVPEFKANEDPLSPDHMDTLASWAQEKDDSGSPLRPWAKPGHKDHERAVRYIQAAAMDPDFDVESPEGFQALLGAVDQRMGGKPDKAKPGTPAVLSGNGDASPRDTGKSAKLTPEQMRVAENMGYTQKQYAELIQKYGVK